MQLRLDGRTILVTGGSSGIGLAVVETLIAEGAQVVTCARDAGRLASATSSLPEDRLLTMPVDVTDREQVDRLIAAAVDRFGQVDGLVLNAGRSLFARLDDTSPNDWRDEFDLKFSGVLHPLQSALPLLRRSEVASVVIMNAVLARQPEPRLVATSAARAGLLNLARSLAIDLAPDVRVNSVLLGLIDTGQWRRRFQEAERDESFAAWSARIAADRGIALGRFGTAHEVAPMVAMMMSPLSAYLTGAAIEISGGVGRYV